jgi:hypothetical protein
VASRKPLKIGEFGGRTRARTWDPLIKSLVFRLDNKIKDFPVNLIDLTLKQINTLGKDCKFAAAISKPIARSTGDPRRLRPERK